MEDNRNEVIRGLRKSGRTLSAIGKDFGISKERVRQLTKGIVPNKPKKVKALKRDSIPIDKKICSKCGQLKDKSEFHKSYDGLCSKCKICAGEDTTMYHRQRKHGMGRDAYLNMLAKQDNKCAICKRDAGEFIRELAIDHDHKTGKIRGLLCWGCNLMLGNAKDNVVLLNSAIDYLNKSLDNKDEVLYTIESQV